jgi:hypothetical protein
MIDVLVRAEARDACDPAPRITLVAAESSEPPDDRGDGHTETDVDRAELGTEDFALRLRAERDGRAHGRTYTLRYATEDDWGNRTEATVEVRVPHDQGPRR